MPRYVITDTSVLIHLQNINRLKILRDIYQEITITPEISKEFGKPLPSWIKTETIKDKKYQDIINTQLDLGESSAIALAIEHNDSLLILDDLKERKLAQRIGLTFTGTLGVVNKAKELGLVDKIRPLIDDLQKVGLRISSEIIDDLLKRNNE
jgi:predicted nucleic acid-binding protein